MKILNKIEKIITQDGSFTIKSNLFEETYHSVFGAISESNHVFINAGFEYISKPEFSIFEVGFGTGINAFLSLEKSIELNKKITYSAIEKYPIPKDIIQDYSLSLKNDNQKSNFQKINDSKWEEKIDINKNFSLHKIESDFTNFKFKDSYDLIYFDAFSYNTQPEMWSEEIFKKIFSAMKINGILVTYSSKGKVKENLRSAGFTVKRLPGFKKRHMLRAIKTVF